MKPIHKPTDEQSFETTKDDYLTPNQTMEISSPQKAKDKMEEQMTSFDKFFENIKQESKFDISKVSINVSLLEPSTVKPKLKSTKVVPELRVPETKPKKRLSFTPGDQCLKSGAKDFTLKSTERLSQKFINLETSQRSNLLPKLNLRKDLLTPLKVIDNSTNDSDDYSTPPRNSILSHRLKEKKFDTLVKAPRRKRKMTFNSLSNEQKIFFAYDHEKFVKEHKKLRRLARRSKRRGKSCI